MPVSTLITLSLQPIRTLTGQYDLEESASVTCASGVAFTGLSTVPPPGSDIGVSGGYIFELDSDLESRATPAQGNLCDPSDLTIMSSGSLRTVHWKGWDTYTSNPWIRTYLIGPARNRYCVYHPLPGDDSNGSTVPGRNGSMSGRNF